MANTYSLKVGEGDPAGKGLLCWGRGEFPFRGFAQGAFISTEEGIPRRSLPGHLQTRFAEGILHRIHGQRAELPLLAHVSLTLGAAVPEKSGSPSAPIMLLYPGSGHNVQA